MSAERASCFDNCWIGLSHSRNRNDPVIRWNWEVSRVVPELSDEAWALLGMIHRASHGGPVAPAGFEQAYAELQAQGLAFGAIITSQGEAALRARYLDRDDLSLRRQNGKP